jgi:hypothetical protein
MSAGVVCFDLEGNGTGMEAGPPDHWTAKTTYVSLLARHGVAALSSLAVVT